MSLIPDKIEEVEGLRIKHFNLLKHNENNIENPLSIRKNTKAITLHNLEEIITPLGTTMSEAYVRATYYGNMEKTRYNYILDKNDIWCSLPETWQNWSSGDSEDKYNSGNLFSISIAVIGNFKEVKEKLIKLILHLLQKYSLSSENIKRHDLNDSALCNTFTNENWKELIDTIKIKNKEVIEDPTQKPVLVNKKITVKKDFEITASVFVDNKWETVTGINEIIIEKSGRAINAFALKIKDLKYSYRAHLYNGGWFSWITQYNLKDWFKGLSGLRKEYINGLQINTNSNDTKIKYRIMPVGQKEFLPWIENQIDFAISSRPISKIQIKIEG